VNPLLSEVFWFILWNDSHNNRLWKQITSFLSRNY